MKKHLHLFILLLLYGSGRLWGQTATVSLPFSIGRTSCGSGTHEVHFYSYNGTTNALATQNPPAACVPLIRTGGTNRTFTSSVASVSYNPKDQNIYYFWTNYSGGTRTYAWRWPLGTCPTSNSPRLDSLRSFAYDILGVAFDKSGNGWMLEFDLTGPPYRAYLRSIDFVSGIIGQSDTLNITGGKQIWASGSGDIAISPSGQMYFVVDNKLFTPDYLNYGGAGKKITCTYIDTVKAPSGSGMNLVGLTYAEGKLIASYSGSGSCPYRELNPLTGDTSMITQTGTLSTTDFASVISGIGSSKRLVAVNATGTPGQYDVIYEVYVQNYGGYPLSNVQVTDNLGAINGSGNVSNVSTVFTSNPAGLTLNASYNGTSNTNLLAASQNLPNYPVSQNSFTIQISCRLSNIQQGVVYNNSAIATANGFNSAALRDSSTNGSYPDLNNNDKPDDWGEGVPTPLLIAITSQTPPCTSIGQLLYAQDFGTGVAAASLPASPSASSGYTGTLSFPLLTETFTLVQNTQTANAANFISLTDHTGNAQGRMMVVNADAANTVFYRDTIATVCSGQQYTFAFYAAFIGNSTYQTVCNGFGGFKYPKVKMRIRDANTGLVITEISTADISSTAWAQYGMKWIMPAGIGSVIFEMMNDGLGGCGNDIALDDIQFGLCDALPVVSLTAVSGGCIGSATTFSASLSDPAALPGGIEYQWQISTDNTTWANISGATSSTYAINPVTVGDVGKYYRVLVAATGNMSASGCNYTSPSYQLTAKASSVAATSITKDKGSICPGTSVALTLHGGSLGTNASWNWYSASCGGTLIGTGTSVSVAPLVTTTYYVRAEGDCNTTACIPITITVDCDIDDDDDGITDLAESGGVDPLNDSDSDGILDYLDADYPGFVDANADGVNDNFDYDKDGIINELDLDSDNDGVPDVVEAGGVDADGNGKIDNYTDTDADGLSQNVDANSTGHLASGNGLGLTDTDGDGVPNQFDLDSDNDGIPDVIEALGTDLNNDGIRDNYIDTDGDGFNDLVDGDVGNDAVSENSSQSLMRTGADGNGDGRADSYPYKNLDKDVRANPYDLDSDNDGITDVREAGFADANYDGFSDGVKGSDGWDNAIDALGTLTLSNTDGSGYPNYIDIDSDDDGIPDNVEGLPTLAYMLPAGLDTDGDGLDNAYDLVNGFGGAGINPNDQDADTVPDYMDLDTDNDGQPDLVEGNDFNLNGLPDDLISLLGVDTDGDGLDDRYDANNSSAEATSAYMGTGGSHTGDPTPGSRTMVQNTVPGTERDWRYIPFLLDGTFKLFHAVKVNEAVQLRWTIESSKPVTHFEVERAASSGVFRRVGQIAVASGEYAGRQFHFTDLLAGIRTDWLQYRIRAVTANGQYLYSAVEMILMDHQKGLQVTPNPANGTVQLVIRSDKEENARLLFLDETGRVVLRVVAPIHPGTNKVLVQEAEKLRAGLYTLRVQLGSVYFTEKIIIQK